MAHEALPRGFDQVLWRPPQESHCNQASVSGCKVFVPQRKTAGCYAWHFGRGTAKLATRQPGLARN